MTVGVLPVPPSVILPTEMTGQLSSLLLKTYSVESACRMRMAAPYTQESEVRSGPQMSELFLPYIRSSMYDLMANDQPADSIDGFPGSAGIHFDYLERLLSNVLCQLLVRKESVEL